MDRIAAGFGKGFIAGDTAGIQRLQKMQFHPAFSRPVGPAGPPQVGAGNPNGMYRDVHFPEELKGGFYEGFGPAVPPAPALGKDYNHTLLVDHPEHIANDARFGDVFTCGYNPDTVHGNTGQRFMELFAGHDTGCGLARHFYVDEKGIEMVGMISENKAGAGKGHVFRMNNDRIKKPVSGRNNCSSQYRKHTIRKSTIVFFEAEVF